MEDDILNNLAIVLREKLKIIVGKRLTAVVCLALPLTTVFSYHKQFCKILTEKRNKKILLLLFLLKY